MNLSLPPFWASWLPAHAVASRPIPSFPSLSSFSALSSLRSSVTSSLTSSLTFWLQRPEPVQPLKPAELRIDVDASPENIEHELQGLHERLNAPGDSLHGIQRFQLTEDPDFIAHYREADGEHYVYVEDVRNQRLAGYTVFNRLIELNKRADRHLRAPHSKYADGYQRRGLATAVYRWALDNGGQCLVSGARQSNGAQALWNSLAREYEQGFVRLESDKSVTYLGTEVDSPQLLDDLATRRILLGRGWSIDRLAREARMHVPQDCLAMQA